MRSVFLAIPVQGSRLPNEVYRTLVDILGRLGLRVTNPEVLRPPLPDEVNRYSASDIHAENRRLLATSDLLVAEISSPSLGVGYEIATAEHLSIPMLCVYQRSCEQYVSLMIRGSLYGKLRIVAYQTPNELEAVISEVLREFTSSAVNEQLSEINPVEHRIAVDHHFDELAAVYDVSADWRRDEEMLSWFRSVLSESKRCLDLGTGTGLVGELLQRDGIFVVGVDRSLGMLNHARLRFNKVVRADVLALPFSDAEFDAVPVRQVFHYVDDRACLKEIARVTAPDALLACAHIAAPDSELALWWREVKRVVQPLRRRFYTSKELVVLVTEAGFEIEQADTIELGRSDSWERFLRNINSEGEPEAKLAVYELLLRTPKTIADRIKLQISDAGVAYTQHWLVLLGRRHRQDAG